MLMCVLTLFRPVGLEEMRLILEANSRAFPPRLPEQPIFYPVLNIEYAEQIARDWNTKDPNSGYAGFVTAFDVDTDYANQYEVQTVGAAVHQELWVPAEKLEEFNRHIIGAIRLKSAHYGKEYRGLKHWYKDWYADDIFINFYHIQRSPQDFSGETTLNKNAILLNFQYWAAQDYTHFGISHDEKLRLLKLIAWMWESKYPQTPLPGYDLISDKDE
jgi:hypothetical protein